MPPPPAAKARAFGRAANAFGLELWQKLRSNPGNLVYSPASVATALVMLFAGAEGQTALELGQVLHLGGNPHESIETAGAILRFWNDPARRSVSLRVASRLYGDRSVPFRDDYLRLTGEQFDAVLEALDFQTGADSARQRINGWVAERTRDRIRDVLPPGSVDEATRLVLVNAIHFLGDWGSPFLESLTRPEPFFVESGQPLSVPMMHQTGGFRLADLEGAQLLELPYRGGTLSMYILLPVTKHGLGAVEQGFDAAALERGLDQLRPLQVELFLPRFTLEPQGVLRLGPPLRELGMRDALAAVRANFGSIAAVSQPTQALFVSEVFHKAFIKVDEKGTEAAAATAIGLLPSCAPNPTPTFPRVFRADHPFLFFIREAHSGMVLFLGRLAQP